MAACVDNIAFLKDCVSIVITGQLGQKTVQVAVMISVERLVLSSSRTHNNFLEEKINSIEEAELRIDYSRSLPSPPK